MLNGLKTKWTDLSHAKSVAIGDEIKAQKTHISMYNAMAHQRDLRAQLSRVLKE